MARVRVAVMDTLRIGGTRRQAGVGARQVEIGTGLGSGLGSGLGIGLGLGLGHAAGYSLLTTHYSLLTTHYSLLTTHYSLLTTHYSLPTTHYSLLTTHCLLLTTLPGWSSSRTLRPPPDGGSVVRHRCRGAPGEGEGE
eukprot:scaffold55925_cov63-Phaeocystis_antarctica.AAC.3